MKKAIEENFNKHATEIPRKAGTSVFDTKHLSYVDSGLSCDTFNIIHVTDGHNMDRSALKAVLDYYEDRKLHFCLWVAEEQLTSSLQSCLTACGLQCQNTEVGMSLDLDGYKDSVMPSTHIHRISDPESLSHYAKGIACNWDPPDENVIRYYLLTADWYLASDSPATLFGYFEDGQVVATLELFQTDNKIAGLYGFSTLEAFRGRGIGSLLLAHGIAYAKSIGLQTLILQATDDGIGIYKSMGFIEHTTYFEFG